MSGGLSMYDTLDNDGSSSSGRTLEVEPGGPSKKLARGISRATENESIISNARIQLAGSDTPEFTFSLPDLSIYPDDFREFLEKDLIEQGCLNSLEAAGRLNWWCNGKGRVLWPLATAGDGNCLLHAASLGMWGYQDRCLKLRDSLHNMLTKGEYRQALFRRWKWRQTTLNAVSGLSYTDAEWKSEWQAIVDMASINPRNPSATSYQSLEEIHIFALAHILRRPIIVIAETMLKDSEGVALAPIPFGGIYLPLEVPYTSCHRNPLLLAYHSAHFSPLVTVDSTNQSDTQEGVSIPLIDPDTGQLFPVHFDVDPGEDWDWMSSQDLLACPPENVESLVKEYLDCEYQIINIEDQEKTTDTTDGTVVKSRSSKQLLGVAKFGSIGKSMSKLWSMTKRPKSPEGGSEGGGVGECLLCVRMKINRHQFVDQMLQNYLESAHARYVQDNQHCLSEMNYGAGKSKFYAVSDSNSHASVSKLPAATTNKDKTLYLSRSTFYDQNFSDTSKVDGWNKRDSSANVEPCRTQDCKFFGSKEHEYFCSQCWANRRH